jgi:hypothetical protein
MNRAFKGASDPTRLPLMLVVLATLLGAGCTGDPSPVALSDSPDSPAGVIPLDASGAFLSAVTYTGIPYGPSSMWTLNKLEYGPAPFTASQNYISADTLILQINAARN